MTLAEKLAARIAAAKAQALIDQVKAEAAKSAPKEEKAKFVKELPLCGCGCGQLTGGGVYRPGHDAKHKSALFVLAKEGDEDALAILEAKGWLKLMAAPKPPTEPKVSRKAQHAQEDEWAIEYAKELDKVTTAKGYR